MATMQDVKIGSRVRLHSPSHVLILRADTGKVVRKDEWADYYVIHLDQPALYRRADGSTEELTEVCESVDNMDILPNGG